MIKTVLKFIFAFAIIFWLFKKGALDFSLVSQSLNHPLTWIICLTGILSNAFITSLRWRSLLQIKTETKLPAIPVIKLTWIGMFFSSVLPGAVTGDIIKMLYAKQLNEKLDKSFLLTSVFLDRLIGLIGLLFIMGVMSIIFYKELFAISPQMKHLILLDQLLFAGSLAAILSIFIPKKMQNFTLRLIDLVPFINEKIKKIFNQIWLIGAHKKIVVSCIISAIFSQIINVLSFWILVSPFLTVSIPWKYAFSFLPLGFIAVAIPISPAGLGVGHAIFSILFGYFGVKSGASLFNLFFIGSVFINLLGVIPFLLHKKQN